MSDSNYIIENSSTNIKATIIDISRRVIGATPSDISVREELNNFYERVNKIEVVDMSLLLADDENANFLPPTKPIYLNLNGYRNIEQNVIPLFFKHDPNSIIQKYDHGNVAKNFKEPISKLHNINIDIYSKNDNDVLEILQSNCYKFEILLKIYTINGVYFNTNKWPSQQLNFAP
tara:strand:+ start:48 stop:572 length:525 start_codon:yes stop_codon:yes gene_type:complete